MLHIHPFGWMQLFILIPECIYKEFEDLKRWMCVSGWKSKGGWIIIIYSHKSRGKSTDYFNIEKCKINLKHEHMRKLRDISGRNSGSCSWLVQKKKMSGLSQVRDICWETLHESFYFNSSKPENKNTTKVLMNKLWEILFWEATYSWNHNILVYSRFGFDFLIWRWSKLFQVW